MSAIRYQHLKRHCKTVTGLLSSLNMIFDGGYHQVELHPESQVLTTFSTHMGLKRYKRLIFGLSSASEIYQYVIQEVLQGIPVARNISDDIIVFGKTEEIHDQQLEITISDLAERGVTLNREKCVFSVPELVFFGHKVPVGATVLLILVPRALRELATR